jgi:hypothetical protein
MTQESNGLKRTTLIRPFGTPSPFIMVEGKGWFCHSNAGVVIHSRFFTFPCALNLFGLQSFHAFQCIYFSLPFPRQPVF